MHTMVCLCPLLFNNLPLTMIVHLITSICLELKGCSNKLKFNLSIKKKHKFNLQLRLSVFSVYLKICINNLYGQSSKSLACIN